jgi:hypothetical protein
MIDNIEILSEYIKLKEISFPLHIVRRRKDKYKIQDYVEGNNTNNYIKGFDFKRKILDYKGEGVSNEDILEIIEYELEEFLIRIENEIENFLKTSITKQFLKYLVMEGLVSVPKGKMFLKNEDNIPDMYYIPVISDENKTIEELLKEYEINSQEGLEDFVILNPDYKRTKEELEKKEKLENKKGEIYISFVLYDNNLVLEDQEPINHQNSQDLYNLVVKKKSTNRIVKLGPSSSFYSYCVILQNIKNLIVFSEKDLKKYINLFLENNPNEIKKIKKRLPSTKK